MAESVSTISILFFLFGSKGEERSFNYKPEGVAEPGRKKLSTYVSSFFFFAFNLRQ